MARNWSTSLREAPEIENKPVANRGCHGGLRVSCVFLRAARINFPVLPGGSVHMICLRRLAVAAATLITSISVAHAQTPRAMQQQRDRMATMDRDRVANDLTGANSQVLDRRGCKLSSGQVLSAAKTAAAASSLPCQVTEAALLGVTTERNDLFEIACQSGPRYLVISPGKSDPVDCLLLADEAERAKAAGQQVQPNATCALKGNKNTVAIFAGYAQAAGVPCTVDAGTLLNPDAYEISCANADGYIIERADGGAWTKAPC